MQQTTKSETSMDEGSTGITMETGLTNQMLDKLSNWQDIIIQSHDNPNHVLEVLLQSHDFTIARQWADIHKVDPYYHQVRTLSRQ